MSSRQSLNISIINKLSFDSTRSEQSRKNKIVTSGEILSIHEQVLNVRDEMVLRLNVRLNLRFYIVILIGALIYITQGWCAKFTPSGLEVLLDTFEHSQKEARVNGMYQNSVRFAEIFQCPSGSYMNPEHKCTLWWCSRYCVYRYNNIIINAYYSFNNTYYDFQ